MKISFANLLSCLFVISFVIYSVGCAPQKKGKVVPIPPKHPEGLQKDERSHDVTFTRYSVKKGDTIWKVSKKYGVAPNTIIATNRIADVTDIKIGQTLLIPVPRKPQTWSVSPKVVKRNLVVSRKGFVWPLKNRILSRFGDYKNGRKNTGIDIEAKINDDVLAAKNGKVIDVSNNSDGWGKTIIIKHAQNVHTWYAFNSAILVNKGMQVKRGQVIAKAGQSGKSQRPRLHFKVFVNDKPVNPLPYLPR